MRFLGFEQTHGQVVASFEDRSRVVADYLVACDGAGSAARQQSVGDSKRFIGLVAIHAEGPFEVEHLLLEGGYFLTLGRDGCSFFCYRQPGGMYWSYVVHAESETVVAEQSQDVLLQRVNRETNGWHDLVRKLVSVAKTESVGVRGYYDKEPISSVHDGLVAHETPGSDGRAAVAEELRRRGTALGWTLEQVAEQAQVSVGMLSLIETRKRRPSIRPWQRIRQTLGITEPLPEEVWRQQPLESPTSWWPRSAPAWPRFGLPPWLSLSIQLGWSRELTSYNPSWSVI